MTFVLFGVYVYHACMACGLNILIIEGSYSTVTF